jgi:hypothetical protein
MHVDLSRGAILGIVASPEKHINEGLLDPSHIDRQRGPRLKRIYHVSDLHGRVIITTQVGFMIRLLGHRGAIALVGNGLLNIKVPIGSVISSPEVRASSRATFKSRAYFCHDRLLFNVYTVNSTTFEGFN